MFFWPIFFWPIFFLAYFFLAYFFLAYCFLSYFFYLSSFMKLLRGLEPYWEIETFFTRLILSKLSEKLLIKSKIFEI
ncbi:unnamed protein product [Blepharisma stoltei]|uniref:ATP synthase F0 subunit 8 n=1 Tax=Blepharisma stoltei TaxID=1481888 RepID=A0AAU9IKW0_9CILI|nr:unnamed protein product [Blepharisma stoltei]